MGTTSRDDLVASLQRFGLQRDRLRAAVARHVGISETDLDALEHLEAAGPLTQRDLGDRLSLTSGAVTMLVDRLEAAGWVQRGPHPTDRRYTLIALTAQAGRDTPPPLTTYHAAVRRLATKVEAENRAAITDYLHAAATAASTAADALKAHPRRR
jgi:DNA-binding MarR family transcriptional regulator